MGGLVGTGVAVVAVDTVVVVGLASTTCYAIVATSDGSLDGTTVFCSCLSIHSVP